jgi:hypothetical protein
MFVPYWDIKRGMLIDSLQGHISACYIDAGNRRMESPAILVRARWEPLGFRMVPESHIFARLDRGLNPVDADDRGVSYTVAAVPEADAAALCRRHGLGRNTASLSRLARAIDLKYTVIAVADNGATVTRLQWPND